MSADKLVLVADDFDDAAELLCEVLSLEASYRTVSAKNGREAIDRAQERHLDAAILDVDMPVLDGVQAARGMRDLLGESRPLLIAMTGRADLTDVAASGVFDYVFAKPVPADALLRALETS